MKSWMLLPIALLLLCLNLYSQDIENPLILENEWPGYSIGDPYVLKHNGTFYLYCSTKDSETGVKCWSSRNLVEWDYEGLCSTDPITKGAYAPEVIYWNGTFYMYTSPAGNGHYVLSGPSPTGPFESVTRNLGKSIDGSVYIDDDAGMYFYHASSQGIMGCTMSGPTSFGASTNLNAQMNNGWTEGPCVFKRNGKYYMIYTGNHVISRGYRIDYATCATGPVDQYTPASMQNPILLDALGLHTGLGHGSIFIGPDLDSYYLTYHNLVSGIGPFRRLNFDRIAWNGDKMILLGPTTFPQENPALPDIFDYFERDTPGEAWTFPAGGRWQIQNGSLVQDTSIAGEENWFIGVMDSTTGRDYTAEFNLKESLREQEDGGPGVLFAYADPANYGALLLNSATGQLEIYFIRDGVRETAQVIELPAEYDYSVWHNIRIEAFSHQYSFFVDGMLKHTLTFESKGGRIGYLTNHCHGDFGFIAFTGRVNGSGTFDLYKPVPGKLPAVQYNTGGEGTGYHREETPSQSQNLMRSDEVELVNSSLGGYALQSVEAGEWFKYNINVDLDQLYNAELIYSAIQPGCQIRIHLDDTDISGLVDLSSTGGNDQWKSYLIKDLQLPGGYHTLKVEVVSGSFNFYSMELVRADNAAFDKTVSFDGAFGSGWKYEDGEWRIRDKNAVIDGFGKRAYGSEYWRDYTVETDLLFTRSMNAGVIFRVDNPALGGAGNDPALGTDFLQGYFVGFNFGTVVLGKHNYGWQSLATTPGSYLLNTWYHLRVVAEGNRVMVFVDDMSQPVIDYTDPLPLIGGMAGLRSYNTGVRFDNFHVTSDLLTTSFMEHPASSADKGIKIFPNPAGDDVTIEFTRRATRCIQLLDLKATRLWSSNSTEKEIKLPLGDLDPGIYIIRVEDPSGIMTRKLILH